MRQFSTILAILLISGVAQSTEVKNKNQMAKVPSGFFSPFWLSPVKMKGKKAKPVQPIKIQSFEVMVYPVTVSNFSDFLNKNPQWKKENVSSLFADEAYLSDFQNKISHSNSPITSVSWFAARAYCESVGMRLPTVNEWEYMAAASDKKKDANKDPKFLQRILDWYGEPKAEHLPDVGSIYKNLYGIWDMHGLIWEWVGDFNSSFVTGESREDINFDKNLFCGAGSMNAGDKQNYAAFMRFGFRSSLKGKSSIWNLGFRCVRSL